MTGLESIIPKQNIKINLLPWAAPLFEKYRYCVLYGGRGSGKSYGVASALLSLAMQKRILVLCGREFQNSIRDSVYSLLKQRIDDLNLENFFTVLEDIIVSPVTGSRFIFKGLRQNISSIKSMVGITHLWIEEGDTLSKDSWQVIKPTIRENGSQIWVTFNPKYKTDIIYHEFLSSMPPPNSYIKKINWRDNPFFPETLDEERKYDMIKYPEHYQHIWEGETLQHADAQVFKGCWVVDYFEEDPKTFAYYGLDFGYSVDATAAIRCFIKNNTLFITHEAFKLQLEIDHIGEYCEKHIPYFKNNRIIADSARPETIGFMRRQGYNVSPAKKGKGSVEDGIAFIRAFDKVIIHPRCKAVAREFDLYSYKVEARSGEITTDLVDNNNHTIDALRYSLERLMGKKYADYVGLTRM